MLRLLIDHNFNQRILQGLQERIRDLDAVAARTVGFDQTPDAALLAWAATAGRVIISHDVHTMPRFAISRVRRGDPMPGLVVVPQQLSIGRVIEDLAMLVLCSEQSEWENLIVYLPL